jgi:hypothetical protein
VRKDKLVERTWFVEGWEEKDSVKRMDLEIGRGTTEV